MAADPISILDKGDRKKRLHDHVQLIAGIDANGLPVLLRLGPNGEITVLATSEMAAEATAAAPTYTEGQNAPVSQDLTGNLRVKDTAANAALGTTAGAAVVADANGTIQQYLRGLVKLAITAGGWLVTASLAAGSNLIGKVGIDQTTPGTTNAVQLTGAQLTPASSTVTTDGSVAAGKYSVEFILSSDFAGTILGVAYAGANDAVKSFEAPAGRTLAAIAYTISAGSARLTTI